MGPLTENIARKILDVTKRKKKKQTNKHTNKQKTYHVNDT
jgi:hypothetical protein